MIAGQRPPNEIIHSYMLQMSMGVINSSDGAGPSNAVALPSNDIAGPSNVTTASLRQVCCTWTMRERNSSELIFVHRYASIRSILYRILMMIYHK